MRHHPLLGRIDEYTLRTITMGLVFSVVAGVTLGAALALLFGGESVDRVKKPEPYIQENF